MNRESQQPILTFNISRELASRSPKELPSHAACSAPARVKCSQYINYATGQGHATPENNLNDSTYTPFISSFEFLVWLKNTSHTSDRGANSSEVDSIQRYTHKDNRQMSKSKWILNYNPDIKKRIVGPFYSLHN